MINSQKSQKEDKKLLQNVKSKIQAVGMYRLNVDIMKWKAGLHSLLKKRRNNVYALWHISRTKKNVQHSIQNAENQSEVNRWFESSSEQFNVHNSKQGR